MTHSPPSTLPAPSRPARRPSPLFLLGLLGIAVCQLLLFADLQHWSRHTPLDFPARLVRANMTPLAWCFYLLLLLGLLTRLSPAPPPAKTSFIARFPNRFLLCWLWSVTCWCYFDWMNFYFMRDPATGLRAWEYIGLPPSFPDRLLGYLIAFGAICPGMFLTAEVLSRLGLSRLKSRPLPLTRTHFAALLLFGLLLTSLPILVGGPACNPALWTGTLCLLDPLNYWCRRPSLFADWKAGRPGRTLALGAAGLLCGFLWEFWNFWAGGKWVYHLPFLGPWEHIKYFEMPLPGLVGFIAFAPQCWVMWQSTLLLLHPFVEAERNTDPDTLLARHACF